MTEREQQILDLIRQDPLIPQQELADKLGISRSAIAGHIMHLTQKGHIQGKGYILAPERYALVIGGANMDLCGVADRPLVDGDSTPGSLTASAGGVGRNIADNLARLGSRVEFISALGEDRWAEQLLESCRLAGVGTDHCLKIPGATTSSYLSLHDSDGEMRLALNDMSLIERLDAEQMERRRGPIDRASVLVLDANLSQDALETLFARPLSAPVLVDPVSQAKASKLKPFLSQFDTLKPNALEAELLSGHSLESEDDLPRVADALHELGVPRVLLSLGSRGAYASDCGVGIRFEPSATEVVNVTGAGDALMAGLAHGRLAGWSFADTVPFALAAARLALATKTTINTTMSEAAVRRLMEKTPC
ncbi:PfkB family carbohydrate kinase [Ferrimonas balearica]|uniref:PfkB family carbohydrate kinase n=1 Tax=Ferrimonas balearica TaxID=44012 RepID=UPI001C9940E8|nr:PfkB family carbohydrate kinase [Ferrimonas balearica]MBY5923167.1 winged helix-turn-helix transcriptional regulator [Ferrimonas balearica]MBY5997457.1 winged helix-turn-helix transcriptional regulator [Ferrimonas balearica]